MVADILDTLLALFICILYLMLNKNTNLLSAQDQSWKSKKKELKYPIPLSNHIA